MNSQGFVALNPSSTRMVLLFSDLPNGAMYNTLFKHFNPNLLLEFFFFNDKPGELLLLE